MEEWHAHFNSIMDNWKKDARPQFSILFPYQKEFSCCSYLTAVCWCIALWDIPQAAATVLCCCLWYCTTGMGFFQKIQPSSPAFCTALSGPPENIMYIDPSTCVACLLHELEKRTTEIVCLGADTTPESMKFQLLLPSPTQQKNNLHCRI